MAVIVVRALGLADYAMGTASFSDMAGHWSNPYVAYATSLGIIAGYPDGTFRPDKTVSYDEAATMLVAALGYNADSLTGTWPANFVVKAKSLGILDGIKAGPAGANRGDIAIMAFQTLGAKIGSTDKDGKWTANDPADTMLERLGAKVYVSEADADDGKDETAFVLDETWAENAVVNVRDLLGAYVTAYVNDDDEIIAIKDVKSTFLTGEFEDALAVDEIFAADKDYDIRDFTDADVEYFYNGGDSNKATVYTGNETETFKIAAKVSGKKIDEIYSVSLWEVTAADLFEEDDLDDESLLGEDFALDDNDEIDLGSFALLGVDSLGDIDEDNVVYVYSGTSDDVITRIEVGTEVVTGEVTKINSSGSKVTVDGVVYELADNDYADDTDWDALDIGDEVEFYLDYEGYVFEVELVESEADQYAIILNAEDATGNPITGKKALVELFLADGTVKVFDVAKDADESGALLNDGDWVPSETSVSGIVVEYGVDSDGVIDVITAVDFDEDGAEGADSKVTTKGYFDGYAIASDVIIFTYDGVDPADEDSYGVTTLAKIKGNEYDDVDYLLSSNKIELMVINGEGSSDDEVYGLVTGWFKSSASDTDYIATVLVDGEEVEYEIVNNTNFGAGSAFVLDASEVLYMLKFNAKGQIVDLVEVDEDADDEDTEADLLVDGALAEKYSGSVLKVTGDTKTSRTVDPDAVAYEWDEDQFVVSTVSKSNLDMGVYVVLYDLDEDGVVDVVLFGGPELGGI
ncbi:MAG: S-layer homology domain-containing protein [Anaerovoracaceae bacterium]